ncbi:heat shock protein HtpX [Burkholderiales bacterium]|nr:heat shock protein HtpX [Burkholderiales bacterium]
MKRVFLFVVTNVAILATLVAISWLVGLDGILDERGVGLDLPALLGFSLIFGMGGSFISLALSRWMAKRLTGARVIDTPSDAREMWLVETVRQQAQAAGIPMPEVAIYPAADVNAFATGPSRSRALVAVSEGLLERMNRQEAEAVLAHEVSHVANGDMVTLALIQGVVNSFVLALSRVVGYVVDRVVFKTEDGHGPAFLVTSIVCQIVFGILASPIVFWFSRQREYRADAGAASLVGAGAMIAALERLEKDVDREPLPDSMAALGITGGASLARWFSTHPTLDERIAALSRSA